ncbi:MAG: flagellar basal body protein [Pseudomonadota bacterium]
MGLSALGAGLSGLKANQQALDVEAHNIANLSTEKYQARQANFQESSPSGSGVTLSAQGLSLSAGEGGTDIAKSLVNSMMYKAGFDLSAQVIKAADERMGTLIDIRA